MPIAQRCFKVDTTGAINRGKDFKPDAAETNEDEIYIIIPKKCSDSFKLHNSRYNQCGQEEESKNSVALKDYIAPKITNKNQTTKFNIKSINDYDINNFNLQNYSKYK